MSADHKRPLYAFVLVALLCALIIGNELRSQAAVIGMIKADIVRLVPGVELQQQPSEAPVLRRSQPVAPQATGAPAKPPESSAQPPAPAAVPSPRPVREPARQPQPVGHAHGRSVAHPVDHLVRHLAGHSVGRVLGHSVGHPEVRGLLRTVAQAAHPAHAVPGHVRDLVHSSGPGHGRGNGLALGLLPGRSDRARREAPGLARSHDRGHPHGHGAAPGRGHGHGRGHGPR